MFYIFIVLKINSKNKRVFVLYCYFYSNFRIIENYYFTLLDYFVI